MTRKTKSSLPTGREGRKTLTTSGKADLKREWNMIGSHYYADRDIGTDTDSRLSVMDTAVIAMVNLYLKSLSSGDCNILLWQTKNIFQFTHVFWRIATCQVQ